MDNWFYLDRQSFERLLHDELGTCLCNNLINFGFDSPVSFLIGETSDEIISNIQKTYTRFFCQKLSCHEHCLECSLSLPHYAKLTWFVRRLLTMSPHSKPFMKKSSTSTTNRKQNDLIASDYFTVPLFFMFIIMLVWYFV